MFEVVENGWSCSDGFKLRVAVASKEAIGLELLECMEPLLSVIVEHVFGVYDGNIEVLQSSTDLGSNGLGVVGLSTFELLHTFFELLDLTGVVTGRDAELLDIYFFVIRKFRSVGVRSREPMIAVSVEPLIVSSSRCLADFRVALAVAESKKSARVL
jgi:hypothetical protein